MKSSRQEWGRHCVRMFALAGLALASTATLYVTAARPGIAQALSAVAGPERSLVKTCSANPDLVGETLAEARELVRRCGYHLEGVYRVPDPAPPGTIISVGPPNPPYYRVVVSTGPITSPWAVLPGASGPPVAAACMATLQLAEDGSAGPLTCGTRRVNVEAWYYFALLHLPVMGLAKNSSACVVAAYVVLNYQTGPINSSAYELANVYNGWHVPQGLVDHVLVGTPYDDRCRPFTARLDVAPVDRAGHIAYGYEVAQVLDGSCAAGSPVGGAGYTCTAKKQIFHACWRGTEGGQAQAVCMARPWSRTVTLVSVRELPALRRASPSRPWGLQLQDELYCDLLGAPAGSYDGQAVRYSCEHSDVRLLDGMSTGASQWNVRSVLWTGTKYVPGPSKSVVGAWYGAAGS